MKNKFKVGDKVVMATGLVVGEKYNGIALTESVVSAFPNKEAIVEEVYISTPLRDSDNEHCVKLVGNAFYYGEDMLEFVPSSLEDIIDKKITCVINVSSTTQARVLQNIFYGEFSMEHPRFHFVQVFNKYAKCRGYETGVAFSFYKGKPQGVCRKEWYEQHEAECGKIYDFEDLYTVAEGEVKMNKQERIKELKKTD